MSKAKILIAEDERDMRELIAYTLEMLAGYDTVLACDGIEALDLVQVERPDLILLDIRMPRLTGYEVCARLKNDRRTQDIPIMVVSAMGQESEIARGLSLGANDYIVKPIIPEELVNVVERMLRTRLPEKQRVEERLAELLFTSHWTVLLAELRGQERSVEVANSLERALEREAGVRCDLVSWWDERELILILDSRPKDQTCWSLRSAFSEILVGIGVVHGDEPGSFDDVDEIIAAARKNLKRPGWRWW